MDLKINTYLNKHKKTAMTITTAMILSSLLLMQNQKINAEDSELEVWWPTHHATVAGLQPFKAMLKGHAIESYKLYWQVDNDRLNEMQNNYADFPHKEVLVDVNGWNWHESGNYPIQFIAEAANGNRVAKRSVNIQVISDAGSSQKKSQNELTASSQQSTSAPLLNQNLNIWWPKNGVTISDNEPLKAALDGNSIEDYQMYWQVNNSPFSLMENNNRDWPHKEAAFKKSLVNATSDTAQRGAHYITFAARDLNGNLVAQKSVPVNLHLNLYSLNGSENRMTAQMAFEEQVPAKLQAPQAVAAAYQEWKNRYLTKNGADGHLRVQRPENNNDTVSEGQGYGMLAAVFSNDRQTFNQLWNYGKSRLNENGLMAWHVDQNNNVINWGAASDADEDMAYALMIADKKWGGYTASAKALITAIYEFEVEKDTYVLKPGDRWGGSEITNISYFAPSYYKAFAAYTGNEDWNKVANKSYEIIEKAINRQTGLVPDWVAADGSQPRHYMGHHQNDFYYDAVRAPWRLAMDAKLNNDSRAKKYIKLMTVFFANTGMENLKSGYKLDGSPISNYFDDTFISCIAAGAYASENTVFANSMQSKLVSTNPRTYFGSSLRILALLFTNGMTE